MGGGGGAVGAEPSPDARATGLRVFPNPTGGVVRVEFEVSGAADVELTLRDLRGREVAIVARAAFPAGRHEAAVSTDGLAAGSYLVRLRVGERSTVRRLVVVR